MVRLDGRLAYVEKMLIGRKKYFVINRGRQYGKTTMLRALEEYLKDDYLVLSLDFQQLGTGDFADEIIFSRSFAELAVRMFEIDAPGERDLAAGLMELKKNNGTMKELFVCLSDICKKSPRPVILMIDEVDSASNNQVFMDFLAQLRSYYLNRDKMPIFHSVILAGVYDIKNLKLKLRPDSEHQYNSPWNIAADFDVNMNFSEPQIAEMIEEYEADNRTGMDEGGH